jgi:hypothetical protein
MPDWHEGSLAGCLADGPSLKVAGEPGQSLIVVNSEVKSPQVPNILAYVKGGKATKRGTCSKSFSLTPAVH